MIFFFRDVGTGSVSVSCYFMAALRCLRDFSVRLYATVMFVSSCVAMCVNTRVSFSWFYFRKPPVNDIKKHGTKPTRRLRLQHASVWVFVRVILGKWGPEFWSSVNVCILSVAIYFKYWFRMPAQHNGAKLYGPAKTKQVKLSIYLFNLSRNC